MKPRDVLIDMDTEKLSVFYRESLINSISEELDVLEWTNHLKVSLKKVLNDGYVLGKLYLFIGEGAFFESRKNSHKATGTFDLDIIRWKMNDDRNLLKYIGERFGDLKKDEYWYEFIDPAIVIKEKMMAEPIPEKPMKYNEIKVYLNQKGFSIEKSIYENSRGEVVSSTLDIKKKRKG